MSSVQGGRAATPRAAVIPDRPRARAKRCWGEFPERTSPFRAETQRRGGNTKRKDLFISSLSASASRREIVWFFPASDARGTRFTSKNESAPGHIDENKRQGQMVAGSAQGVRAGDPACHGRSRPSSRTGKQVPRRIPWKIKTTSRRDAETRRQHEKERPVYFEPQRLCVSARDCLFFPSFRCPWHKIHQQK